MEYSIIFIKTNGVQYQESMKFKILSVAIMVAATLTALASMPLATTPAYAGGNVHNNNIGNHAGTGSDIDQDCVGGGSTFTNSCTSTVNNPPGPTKCFNSQGKEIPCPK